MAQKIALHYTGGGFGGFLPDVPARDLFASELERFGGKTRLVASGLYTEVVDKRASGPAENKAATEAPES